MEEIVAIFLQKKPKMHILKLFYWKIKNRWKIYMLASYLINKFAVGLKNGLNTASEPGAGSHDHVSVHGCEYLGDGSHQAGSML